MPHHNYYKNEYVDKHQTMSSQRERTQIIFLVAATFTSTHDHDAVKRPIPDISNLNQRISLKVRTGDFFGILQKVTQNTG